jgi:hypothetical protein
VKLCDASARASELPYIGRVILGVVSSPSQWPKKTGASKGTIELSSCWDRSGHKTFCPRQKLQTHRAWEAKSADCGYTPLGFRRQFLRFPTTYVIAMQGPYRVSLACILLYAAIPCTQQWSRDHSIPSGTLTAHITSNDEALVPLSHAFSSEEEEFQKHAWLAVKACLCRSQLNVPASHVACLTRVVGVPGGSLIDSKIAESLVPRTC